jgi:hypothetical protein
VTPDVIVVSLACDGKKSDLRPGVTNEIARSEVLLFHRTEGSHVEVLFEEVAVSAGYIGSIFGASTPKLGWKIVDDESRVPNFRLSGIPPDWRGKELRLSVRLSTFPRKLFIFSIRDVGE